MSPRAVPPVRVRRLLNQAVSPAVPTPDFRHQLRQRLLADAERLSRCRRVPRLRVLGQTIVLTQGRQAALGLLVSLFAALTGAMLYFLFSERRA